MKKFFINALMVVFVFVMISLTACSKNDSKENGGDTSKTEVVLKFYKGTATQDCTWLNTLITNFQNANKETSFEDGKKGVKITYTLERSLPLTTLSSDGADIYMAENDADIYGLAAKGDILDISSIAELYLSKIDSDAKTRMVGPDGNYYAMPSYSWYAGVPYDVDLIESKKAYIAAPDTASVTYESTIFEGVSVSFVANASSKKSCGPDGIYDTVDDGLPSSLEEMIVWCEYLKKEKGVTPFVMGNDVTQYSFYLTHAIWASLAGTDAMRAVYTNFADGGTEGVEVVTGYSDENFYESSDKTVQIKKPITETITLTKENGYRAYEMSARYYSLAFLEIANKEGWISYSNGGNTGAMSEFIVDGENAMLYDASYWYHEAIAKEYLEDWKDEHPEDEEKGRNISFLTMPSQVYGSVSEGNGKKNTLMNLGNSYVFLNSHLDNTGNEGKKSASLAFLEYMYTDEALTIFTQQTGLTVPMDYNYEIPEGADYLYYRNEKAVVENSNVVNYASDNLYFQKNVSSFSLSWQSSIIVFDIPGTGKIYDGYIAAIRNYHATTKSIFEATKRSETTWSELIK